MTFGMALAALFLGMYLGFWNATYAKAYVAVSSLFADSALVAGVALVAGATALALAVVMLLAGDPLFLFVLPLHLQALTLGALVLGWLPTFITLRFFARSREDRL